MPQTIDTIDALAAADQAKDIRGAFLSELFCATFGAVKAALSHKSGAHGHLAPTA